MWCCGVMVKCMMVMYVGVLVVVRGVTRVSPDGALLKLASPAPGSKHACFHSKPLSRSRHMKIYTRKHIRVHIHIRRHVHVHVHVGVMFAHFLWKTWPGTLTFHDV